MMMAWPEVVFVGNYPYIVNRLAHLPDFAPDDMQIVTYEPDDAPAVLPSSVVAVVVDQHDLRDRYEGVPTLCHVRLADTHQHMGKWSITIDGLGMDASQDSLESGSAHVSDDHEARQFCLLFVLAAIDHSLKSEMQTLSDEERSRLEAFEREVFRYLEQFAAPDDDVEAIRLSIESIRLELATSVLDREVVRRCLYRIAWVAEQSTLGDLGELGEELDDLIWTLRAPGQ
jgi:hypothetical protein